MSRGMGRCGVSVLVWLAFTGSLTLGVACKLLSMYGLVYYSVHDVYVCTLFYKADSM